jgi:hypothetical protein
MVLKISVRQIVERIETLWPWHRKDDEEGDDGEGCGMNPVLLVPGIGGSILNAVDQRGHKERVWVRLFEADHEFRSKLFSAYDPVTGTLLGFLSKPSCASGGRELN